jgi:hypothetical protein
MPLLRSVNLLFLSICHSSIYTTNQVLGILASISVKDLPASLSWARLLRDQGLLPLLSRLLLPGLAPSDLLLETVLVFSAAASEPLVYS